MNLTGFLSSPRYLCYSLFIFYSPTDEFRMLNPYVGMSHREFKVISESALLILLQSYKLFFTYANIFYYFFKKNLESLKFLKFRGFIYVWSTYNSPPHTKLER